MPERKTITKTRQGFTIVELLIASAVFALVLLVALAGFLQIGRIFYKGVSASQAQDTARQVLDDISANVKVASTTGAVIGPNTTGTGAYSYLCVGSYRYTWGFYKANLDPTLDGRPIYINPAETSDYDPGKSTANFGLLKDKLPGEGSCPVPCISVGASVDATCPPTNFLALDTNNPTEMLGSGMRVGKIALSNAGPVQDLYNLSVVIAYGDDSVLAYDPANVPYCAGNSSSQKFCAAEQISTTVYRGELHP